VLSKIGTKTYSVEQLFEALSATSLKADLAVEKRFLRMFVFFLSQCGCKSSNFLNPNSFFTIFRQLQGNSHLFHKKKCNE
jgi:transcription-repair coupling factor (superfamily II helicase)